MKRYVYITKHALTRGVERYEIWEEPTETSVAPKPFAVPPSHIQPINTAQLVRSDLKTKSVEIAFVKYSWLGETYRPSEFTFDEAYAKEVAEQMIEKKIAALQKQIDNLRSPKTQTAVTAVHEKTRE